METVVKKGNTENRDTSKQRGSQGRVGNQGGSGTVGGQSGASRAGGQVERGARADLKTTEG